MKLFWFAVLLGAFPTPNAQRPTPNAPDVPLHDFKDVSAWKLNPDGGSGVEAMPDTPGMRVRYTDRPPHWGNLTGPCRIPPEAVALRFRLDKHHSAPQAAMYIWLFEPDGDAWAQQVMVNGQPVGALRPGRYTVRLPVGGFAFEPRGRRTRQMTACDRMLIGCNYGDLEVTVNDMVWETQGETAEAPLPRTPGLKSAPGKRGSVAVLDMGANLPDGFKTAHAPQRLANALREGGFGVTILKAGDLADPRVLTRQNFDAVVLPCGPFFPAEARETFLAYLKAGGSFLSTDGYAFDRPVVWNGQGWEEQASGVMAAQMSQPQAAAAPMNTRHGQPGDAMTFRPEQIGVFDPAFTLEGATKLRTATLASDPSPLFPASREGEGSKALTPNSPLPSELASGKGRGVGGEGQTSRLLYRLAKPLTGFSACGLLGDNSPVFPPVYRRWIPVLEATDDRGSLRGTALSLMHNFAGVYKGSSWAFSGLTSGQDLFLDTPARRQLLCRVMDTITRMTFLHGLTTDYACYRKGETAKIQVDVSNYGKQPESVEVALAVAGKPLMKRSMRLAPGDTQILKADVKMEALTPRPPLPKTGEGSGVRAIKAILRRDGQVTDEIRSAFCAWDERVIAQGMKVGWRNNYLTVDGRPQFLIGTNQTGMMFYSTHENPAVWDADFRRMAANNVHILRILHFSPFAARGYEGQAQHSPQDLHHRPERLCRQMDAIVQLAQKHRVALFLSLHDWQGIALTEEELKAQADWDRFWAARYRSVPGIFYDVQNEPSVDVPDRPDIIALWNDWLKERYGSDDALRAAWRRSLPEAALPNVPLRGGTNEWDDARTADRKRFEAALLNRWVKANVEGIKAGDPNALATVGYLPSMSPADKMLGTKYTDFSNMHYYGSVDGFPLEFKLIDRRFAGKGFSLGEFGAQEAHDARAQGVTGQPVEASVRRFNAVLHYAAGMGAAFVANWDWKEFDEMVFPWGLMQRGGEVPKPWLSTYAQGAKFLSYVQPVYESPEVFLLAPDSNRIGPRFDEIQGALHRAVGLLLDSRVNFGVINEEDLAQLPKSAKALVWPIPYCPDDATFARVLDWVKAGGALYLSGDIAFDRTRRPSRRERRQQLGLPDDAAPVSPFDTPESAWAQPPIERQVGQGRVFFVPFPLELRRQATDGAIYTRFLQAAGVRPIRVVPENAPVRVMSVPTQEGGRLYTLCRTGGEEELLTVTLADCRAATQLRAGGCVFILVNAKGEVTAAESEGSLVIGGKTIAFAEGHFGLVATDGQDLRRSQKVLLLPHQESRVTTEGLRLAGMRP
jgi:hypothetical protein